MDVHRLRSLIDLILDDYGESEVSQRFSEMVNALQAYGNSPSPQTAEAFSSQLDTLRSALSNSRIHELLPLQRRFFDEINGTQFSGQELINEIEEAISSSNTPAEIFTTVQNFHGEFNAFINSITQLRAQFEQLGIEPHETEHDFEEISIILPDHLTNRELEEVETLIHKWGQAFGQVQEVVTGQGGPVIVSALDEGSIVVVFLAAVPVAFATLKLVNGCLEAYERILSIRKKQRELKEMDVSEETLKSLCNEEKKQAEESIVKISKKFLAEFESTIKGGRSKSERSTQIRMAAQFVLKQIDQGVEIEILLLQQADESKDDETADGYPPKSSVVEELKKSSSAWQTLPYEGQPILELPEPELSDPPPSATKSPSPSSEGG